MSFKPSRIIVHHSATQDSGTVSWGAIRRYHTLDRGWSDVGYHAGIEIVNNQFECFYGRPVTRPGAHTRGHNSDSLGICFVGDYNKIKPPSQMLWVAARRVLAPWVQQFGIGLHNIHPHSQYANKACPGDLFYMDELRGIVGRVLAGDD